MSLKQREQYREKQNYYNVQDARFKEFHKVWDLQDKGYLIDEISQMLGMKAGKVAYISQYRPHLVKREKKFIEEWEFIKNHPNFTSVRKPVYSTKLQAGRKYRNYYQNNLDRIERNHKIWELQDAGMSNKAIASEMYMSESGIKYIIRNREHLMSGEDKFYQEYEEYKKIYGEK